MLLQAGSSVFNIIQFLPLGSSQLGREERNTQVFCVLCQSGAQRTAGVQRRAIYLDCWGGLPGGGDALTEAWDMSKS